MAVEAERLIINLEARLNKFDRDMRKAVGISNQQFRAIERRGQQMTQRLDGLSTNLFRRLTVPLGGLTAALGTTELIRLTDTWTDLNSRVSLASGGMERGRETMSRLSEMSRRTYSSIEQTTESWLSQRLTLDELGLSTSQQLDLVETLNNSMVISATRGQAAQSVMKAWGDAMASGALRTDGLNTIISNSPRLVQALAESLGVTVGELRKMASEGTLTSAKMFGVTSQLAKVRREADGMAATISDGVQLLQNAMLEYVGTGDQAVGMSGRIAEALTVIADNFDTTADAALQLASVIAAALLGRSIAGLIARVPAATSAIIAFSTAARAGAVSVTALTAASGPLGLLIGAGAAAIYLFATRQREGIRSTDDFRDALTRLEEVKRTLTDATDGTREALEEERDRLQQNTDEHLKNARAVLAAAKARLAAAKAAQATLEAEQDPNFTAQLQGQLDDARRRQDPAAIQRLESLIAVGGSSSADAEVHRARENSFGPLEQAIDDAQAKVDELTGVVREVGEASARTEREMRSLPATLTDTSTTATKLASAPIETARRFMGSHENRDVDILKQFFRAANHNIDPRMTAWCAAFVNAALAANGLPGTGSLSARSFMNYGEATNDPRRGDIVVLSRGNNAAQGHVGFFEGYDERGNIRVLGGNQSDGVNVQSYSRDRLLGFRTVPGADRESLSETLTAELGRRQEIAKAAQEQSAAYQSIVADVVNYVAAVNGEAAAVGQSAEQTAALRHEMDLLNQITSAGIQLTPQITAQVKEMAAGMAAAESAAQRLGVAQSEMESMAGDATRGIIDDLRAGKSAAEAFAGALDRIVDRLLDMAINKLFEGAFAGLGGGGGFGGALVSALFGGRRANGGSVQAGKVYQVGERGPEHFVPGRSGTIIPNGGLDLAAPSVRPITVQTSAPTIKVFDQRTTQSEPVEIRESGRNEFEVFVRDTARDELTTSGRRGNQALRRGFGVSRGLVTR